MNYKIALLGLIEIVSALSIGLLILSTTYTALKKFGRQKLAIEHNNLAYSIFTASVLFGIGYMVSGIIQPILSSFRLLSETGNDTSFVWEFMGYGAMYIVIAYCAGLIISLCGIYAYSLLTPIDEFKAIKNNNIGVAIIVSAIIITLIMMTRGGVILVIESLIPYPYLPPK